MSYFEEVCEYKTYATGTCCENFQSEENCQENFVCKNIDYYISYEMIEGFGPNNCPDSNKPSDLTKEEIAEGNKQSPPLYNTAEKIINTNNYRLNERSRNAICNNAYTKASTVSRSLNDNEINDICSSGQYCIKGYKGESFDCSSLPTLTSQNNCVNALERGKSAKQGVDYYIAN